MSQPQALIEFKRVTHFFHIAYCMSNIAMGYSASDLEKLEGYNPDGKFQIGNGRDANGKRTAVAEMQNALAIQSMQKNGAFSQTIAHGTISAVYSLWEEEYRAQIAQELGVETNDILSDVMGDIRLLRQFVVHRNGDADKRVRKLKVVDWVQEGPLVFTITEMSKLQELINTMQVDVREANT